MLEILMLLLLLNAASFGYVVHILFYTIKGIYFLEYSKSLLLENDEEDELEILSNNDMPLFMDYLLAIKGMIYFIIITIFVNMIMGGFAFFPVLYETSAWTIVVWMAALTNAFVMISMHQYRDIKAKINATCESYNLIIQSYGFIHEYEDNNDSAN